MKVGIVVCAYQAESTIGLTLEAIANQTWPHWKCLVFIDGATDDTFMIARQFAKMDKRFEIVYSKKNRGLAKARNLSVRLLDNEWIAFCDADDVWLDNKLETQMAMVSQYNFICGLSQYINHDTGFISKVVRVPGKLNYPRLLMGNPIGLSTVLLHKSLLHGFHFSTPAVELVHEDYALWVQIFQRKKPRAILLKTSLALIGVSARTMSSNKWLAFKSHYAILRKFAGLNQLVAASAMVSYLFLAFYKRGFLSLWSQYKK